jgi:hypothetical protein
VKKYLLILLLPFFFVGCLEEGEKKDECCSEETSNVKVIDEQTINAVIEEGKKKDLNEAQAARFEKGVHQVAALWQEEDGCKNGFKNFCLDNFVKDDETLAKYAKSFERSLEIIYGHFNKIQLDLLAPLHLDLGEMNELDAMFGTLSPGAAFAPSFFSSKIAFVKLLNFPTYTLEEKMELGKNWSRQEWAYARIGDMFTSRVPSAIQEKQAAIATQADQYIAEYNIMMGYLTDDKGGEFFPEDMALITHWNLRDEIKAQYANKEDGLAKQQMIYQVMQRIVDQSIPECVISSKDYKWDPYTNVVYKDGKEVPDVKPEPCTRYEWILKTFRGELEADPYNPSEPTALARSFNSEKEVPVERIKTMFTELISSPQAKEVGELISKRLGRDLQPYDIWYNGFKGEIDGEKLDVITKSNWPDPAAFKAELPTILKKLGWSPERAKYITDKIDVDPSRGAGHAWGAQMKGEQAHLRTRIGKDGMDYKGYNIAVHEFGHNVEQTVTLYDMDNWFLQGVPNTAFTEAAAFLFQARDLQLIGQSDDNPNKKDLYTLDVFWSAYEIMGVALVDIQMWEWMYENKDATPEQLRDAVLEIAKEVWNEYYAPVLGMKDQTILAVYSHMISSPIYLSNYPFGHLVEFQLEQQMEGKVFADEFDRIYKQGRLTPDVWMNGATGSDVSVKPLLKSTEEALKNLK